MISVIPILLSQIKALSIQGFLPEPIYPFFGTLRTIAETETRGSNALVCINGASLSYNILLSLHCKRIIN